MNNPNRKWIYNPYVHNSVDQFAKMVTLLEKNVAPWELST